MTRKLRQRLKARHEKSGTGLLRKNAAGSKPPAAQCDARLGKPVIQFFRDGSDERELRENFRAGSDAGKPGRAFRRAAANEARRHFYNCVSKECVKSNKEDTVAAKKILTCFTIGNKGVCSPLHVLNLARYVGNRRHPRHAGMKIQGTYFIRKGGSPENFHWEVCQADERRKKLKAEIEARGPVLK